MSTWNLTTDRFLAPYTPTFVANGYHGITGDWLGLGSGECHIANIYNRGSDAADTVRARLPAYLATDLHNGIHWLAATDMNTTLIRNYTQELDIQQATLHTRYRWHDGDYRMDIASSYFASRADHNLAAQKLTLTPHFNGPIQLQLTIDSRRGDLIIDHATIGQHIQGEQTWALHAAPIQRDSSLAIAVAVRLEGANELQSTAVRSDQTGVVLRFVAEAGVTYTLTRVVVVGELHLADALTHAHRARSQGYSALHAAHCAAWADLWQGAIEIEGDDQIQRIVRASQYGLLSSMRAGSGYSLSPMGLSTRGYGGHIFWDADTWMFPALLLTHPAEAQGCVEYRCDRLDGAREKARKAGYQGAMFPWEGDDLGVETTPDWAPCGQYEQHVTSCVALAVWQWYQATNDQEWLRHKAWPLLQAAATFWLSRVSPTPNLANSDPQLSYHIRDIQAADEYALHVDDNAWTNASAARCLQIASQAAGILGLQAPPEWLHIAEHMYIPFDTERQITLEYQGYTDEIIKQADVVLLDFPLNWPLPAGVAANNARYYASRIDAAHGPAMTYAIHAIIAAQTGDQELFEQYLRDSYQHNLRPPFESFSETPDLNYCTFVTGAGGLLQALIYGCCGARLSDAGLTFPHAAMLPRGWQRLSVRLVCRGLAFQVTVTPTGRVVEAVKQ
jgi:trehalose/maltose hydrolase-like predicted phosphorylase